MAKETRSFGEEAKPPPQDDRILNTAFICYELQRVLPFNSPLMPVPGATFKRTRLNVPRSSRDFGSYRDPHGQA